MSPVLVVALVVLVAGCTGHASPPTARATASSSAAPTGPTAAATGAGRGTGCGGTPISPGRPPAWTADAGLPPDVPYAVSREANVVAVLFGYPLRAGHRQDGVDNKILWDVREPRDGKPLHVTARPLAGGSAASLTFAAGAHPGEIYPSVVDVPTPGCWRLTLEWNGHTATIDLPYEA
jgi:hypothetical protein